MLHLMSKECHELFLRKHYWSWKQNKTGRINTITLKNTEVDKNLKFKRTNTITFWIQNDLAGKYFSYCEEQDIPYAFPYIFAVAHRDEMDPSDFYIIEDRNGKTFNFKGLSKEEMDAIYSFMQYKMADYMVREYIPATIEKCIQEFHFKDSTPFIPFDRNVFMYWMHEEYGRLSEYRYIADIVF